MKTFSIISQNVPGIDLYTNSLLDGYLIYNSITTIDDVLNAIPVGTTRVGFVWQNIGGCNIPFFFNNKRLFLDYADRTSDNMPKFVTDTYKYFSNDIIQLFTNLKNKLGDMVNIDLITCDLNQIDFINTVVQIESDLGIIIDYSIDKTGNYNDGGDWIMESNNNLNIKPLYFNDNINNWNYILDGPYTLATLASLCNTNVMTIVGNTLTLLASANWPTDFGITYTNSSGIQTPITLRDYDTIAGNSHTITILSNSTLTYNGIFYSTAVSAAVATLSDFGVDFTTATLGDYGGGIMYAYATDSSNSTNFSISDCYSNGIIHGQYAGGICGIYAGLSGTCSVANCYSNGIIHGQYAGVTRDSAASVR